MNFNYIITKFYKIKKHDGYDFDQPLYTIKFYEQIFDFEIDEILLKSIISIELDVLSNTIITGMPYRDTYDILNEYEGCITGRYMWDDNENLEFNPFFNNLIHELNKRGYKTNGQEFQYNFLSDIESENLRLFFKNIYRELVCVHFKDVHSILLNTDYLPSNRSSQIRINNMLNQNKAYYKLISDFQDDTKDKNTRRIDFIDKWLSEFELKIVIEDIAGVGYVVKNNYNKSNINLADEGYGYSQLLPIIMCVLNEKQKIIIIEEPETNLHPALQSKLADMFIEASKLFNIQFVIETHSEYIIRRLQYLTAKKEIKSVDTIIHYLFNPESEHAKQTGEQLRTIRIKEDGRLDKEFGTGFFDESTKLIESIWNARSLN